MDNWHQRIEDAASPLDLVCVARDFLTSWSPQDLGMVPEHARPQRVKGVDDIAYWHQRLVDCYCSGAAQGAECAKVRDMLQFFAFAVQRAAEIDSAPPIGEHQAAARLFSERSLPRLFSSAMTGVGDS